MANKIKVQAKIEAAYSGKRVIDAEIEIDLDEVREWLTEGPDYQIKNADIDNFMDAGDELYTVVMANRPEVDGKLWDTDDSVGYNVLELKTPDTVQTEGD